MKCASETFHRAGQFFSWRGPLVCCVKRIGYNSGYTASVKTAVSLPDDIFRLADAAARRLRVSRSQLYATAISEFLNRQQGNAVTERLNQVYSGRPATVDPALHRAQLRSIEKDSW